MYAGRWIPEGIWDETLQPLIRNFAENTATVQFDHRTLAYTSLAATLLLVTQARRMPHARSILARGLPYGNGSMALSAPVLALCGLTLGQVTLGVTALMHYVPVHLGVLHQAGALSVWTGAFWLLHALKHVR